MTFSTNAQQPEVPATVKSAFEQSVPKAKDVAWEYDSEDQLWEAEYEIGKDEFTSAFDENGNLVETEQEISYSKLPKPVKATLQADYAGFEMEEAELVQTSDQKLYEVEVEMEKDGKEVEYELLISPDGKVVEKEAMEDDELEEDEKDED
jgi:hypothetical protein